jgi:hypothetical protein
MKLWADEWVELGYVASHPHCLRQRGTLGVLALVGVLDDRFRDVRGHCAG